jgi:hypothetical protein
MGLSVSDHNPFHCHGPIRERELFFGRSAIVRDVLYSLLENGQSVALIGKEKIGKTSFLFYVASSETVAEVAAVYEFTPRDHAFVCLNCESMKETDEAGCFLRIKDALEKQILTRDERLAPRLNGIMSTEAYAKLCDTFRILKRAAVQPVVQLDDFDCLAVNSRLSHRFFGGLRALSSNYNVSYLTTSRVSLDELERRAPRIAGSPFFNIFLSRELPSFNLDESRELLENRLASVDVVLPEVIQNLIFELSRHEPYRLQLAGACAYELWQKNAGKLSESHCEELNRWFNDALSSDSLE